MKLALVIPGTRRSAFGRPAPNGMYLGSSYKIGEALRQLCDFEVLRLDHPLLENDLACCDCAVVKADRPSTYALALGLGLPYVLICHDVATMRDPHYDAPDAEQEMIESAAAVIFVTDPLHLYCEDRYQLPPHEVVPLRPLARDLEFEPLPKLPGKTLVYAGGIVERHLSGTPWGYRAYHDIFAAALDAGWKVHVYPALPRPRATSELREMGCDICDPVPEPDLPRELSRYTAGLQAYNTCGVPAEGVRYASLAWPNKTYLYLSAGIPTIGTNPGWESARIYEGRWGICLDSPAGFADLQVGDLPVITRELRYSQTIEHDLPKLRRLLAKVEL